MCYYNRPNLIRFGLKSIKEQSYKNWNLVLIDDGSNQSAYQSMCEILNDDIHKCKYINTYMAAEDKIKLGGSLFGLYWTHACLNKACDLGVMLCDDDALVPDYLENLNQFFVNNPNEMWCYTHYKGYDPYAQKDFSNIKISVNSALNTERINPDSKLDASQVAFKLNAFRENYVEFGYPKTANLDSDLYRKLYPIYGPCPYAGFFGQYKGLPSNRLENRQFFDSATYSHDIDINFTPFNDRGINS
jgi:glycosyltransferase involved in cell wall biosynthesis